MKPTLTPALCQAIDTLRAAGYDWHGSKYRRCGLYLLISAPPRPGEPRVPCFKSAEEVLALAAKLRQRAMCPLCDAPVGGFGELCLECATSLELLTATEEDELALIVALERA